MGVFYYRLERFDFYAIFIAQNCTSCILEDARCGIVEFGDAPTAHECFKKILMNL